MQSISDKELLKCHFVWTDKLADMLESKRMTGRYHLKYGKYSRVLCNRGFVWSVEPGFIMFLKQKYGNVTFREAIEKWEESKRTQCF